MGTIIKNGVAITHLNPNTGGGSDDNHSYLAIEKLRRYLYRVTFDKLPQDSGNNAPIMGACSAYVKDGKLNRNYDFKYDNAATFIVRTNDFVGTSMITGLDDGNLKDSLINQLPYRMVDGRNNNGIMVSVHLLFNDWQYTGAGDKSIPLTRLPFEVLTRVKSMATISTDLADVLGNLVVTEAMGDYLLQCLITDGTTTYALVPPTSEGSAYVLVDATAYPKMSNFRYVARASVERNASYMQTRPTGVERFNMMPCALKDLRFTKCYEAATRLSEFIGIDGTDKDSTDEELTAIYNLARAEYLQRQRDGKTWQTMHSVVYGDIMEELYIQENWEDNAIVSGGSSVIPNDPSPTTAVLNKLKIDGTNFALAGNSAKAYNNISAMVAALNAMGAEDLRVGNNLYISTLAVPDLWVRAVESTSVPYTYTTDEAFISALSDAGESGLRIGYYRVRALEAEKVSIPVMDVQENDVSVVVNGIAKLTKKPELTLTCEMADGTTKILKLNATLT